MSFGVTQLLFGQEVLTCISSTSKIQGYFYAGTSVRDTSALGGFWASPNIPQKIGGLEPESGQLSVRVIQDDTAKFVTEDGRKWKGISVLIVNSADSLIGFEAQDSRLTMVCEAFFEQKWIEIEYLPSSWCGNSYHTVFLDKNEYWRFTAPCYSGDTPTKLRFKLNVSKDKFIYSNEIDGGFNARSLNKKQGSKRRNFMNPHTNWR